RRQPRRPLLRCASGLRRHRPRDADLDRRIRRRPLPLALHRSGPGAVSYPQPSTTGDKIMADIGSFTRTETGFTGRVEALGIDAPLTFVPAKPSEAENAPAYRILLGGEDGRDIGAGWSHVG